MKFCGQCTNLLALICPKCRFENPPGFKFCGQCTAPLSASEVKAAPSIRMGEAAADAEAIEGERKTVTALFADIKGSMELMEDLDPEEARAIVDPALKLMIDAVHRYDGYIVQSTGDGIFGLFGAPVAHEDHPQRAPHAAVAIRDAFRRRGVELKQQGRSGVEVRIGINTGEMVLRMVHTGGHTEYTPVGHAANLAARMQSMAPTGGIVISEDTRRLVEGYFELRDLGPTQVKGMSERINVYEVVGAGRYEAISSWRRGAGLPSSSGASASGRDEARARTGAQGSRTNCRRGGGGGHRQVTAGLRVQATNPE
jgi:class 3 adenylate cyclase